MKVIITIGNPHSGYSEVARVLSQAGISSAKVGSKANLSPQALQTQLLLTHEVDLSDTAPLAQVQPGKLWNELATDLFLTNLQYPTWGWADPQSAVLMDFWHDFDAQVRLLLVYNSPANYLEQVLSHDTPPTSQAVKAALDDWARWNTALLRYMHRHPDFCVLVSSQQTAAQPQTLVDTLASHWQISGLDNSAIHPVNTPAYQRLQAHFINQLIDPQHPALSLLQELEGAALLPANSPADSDADAAPSANADWADWAKLQTNLAQLNQQLAQHTAQLAQTSAASAQASLESAELKQENELLLLQLHQVQEELESHFLKNQALSQTAEQSEQLKKGLASLQTLRDSLAKEKAELIKGRDAQAKLLQERQTQLDLALKAQESANKAKEQQAKLVADLQHAVTTLQTQKDQSHKDKATLTQQLEQLKAQLAQATKASAQASLDSAELKQENELLLLQMHQVQEELEHYFLRHQELENSQNSKASGFVTDFWRMHQPQEIVISMQQDIAGSNWYPAESDGRWAGPATLSTVQMPPVQPGSYTLELDIVDAMNPGIVNNLLVEALGQSLPVEVVYPVYKGEYPLICKANISVSQAAAQQAWPLNLRFSQTASPADNGSDDMRNLAVRLRTLKLVKHA